MQHFLRRTGKFLYVVVSKKVAHGSKGLIRQGLCGENRKPSHGPGDGYIEEIASAIEAFRVFCIQRFCLNKL